MTESHSRMTFEDTWSKFVVESQSTEHMKHEKQAVGYIDFLYSDKIQYWKPEELFTFFIYVSVFCNPQKRPESTPR